jgi:hypothetical protein
MSWTAHYFDPRLNRDAVTRAFGSKDDALRAACDLIARKCIVHSVQGTDNEKIGAVAITKWCKAHKRANVQRLRSSGSRTGSAEARRVPSPRSALGMIAR